MQNRTLQSIHWYSFFNLKAGDSGESRTSTLCRRPESRVSSLYCGRSFFGPHPRLQRVKSPFFLRLSGFPWARRPFCSTCRRAISSRRSSSSLTAVDVKEQPPLRAPEGMAINGQPLSDGESEQESYSCLPEENSFGSGNPQKSREFSTNCISDFSSEALHMSRRSSRCCKKRSRSRKLVLNRLLRQLRSLRSAGPCSDRRSKACAIHDALSCSNKLWRGIHDLRYGLSVFASEKADHRLPGKSKVEVVADDSGVRVHVLCEKLPGLTVVLMQALERCGLIFRNVNLSCHNILVLNAVGVQVEGRPVETEDLRRKLMSIIEEHTTKD